MNALEKSINRILRYDLLFSKCLDIRLNNVSAQWSKEETTLSDVNLEVQKGKLVAVIGSVGAGKVHFVLVY